MKKFRWVFLLLGMVATSLVSGCLFWHSEPDVIVWKTAGIPQEWVERQIKAVEMKHGLVTTEVGVAGQFNENGYGQSYWNPTSLLLRCCGALDLKAVVGLAIASRGKC